MTTVPNPFNQSRGKPRHLKVAAFSSSSERKRPTKRRNIDLFTQLRNEGKNSVFDDQRLHETRSDLSADQKYLRRLTHLRLHQTKTSKFALTEDDPDASPAFRFLEEEKESINLTHDGIPVGQLSDLSLSRGGRHMEDEEFARKEEELEMENLRSSTGADLSGVDRKSRKEIFDEIISKSKEARIDRARQRKEIEDTLEKLDAGFSDLRKSLHFRPSKFDGIDNVLSEDHIPHKEGEDTQFDMLTSSFRFASRVAAGERRKTGVELAEALEAKLEKLENERLQRMEGRVLQGDTLNEEHLNEEADEEEEEEEEEDLDTEDVNEGDLDMDSHELDEMENEKYSADELQRSDSESHNQDQLPSELTTETSDIPFWLRNEEDEADLPYRIKMPSSTAGFHLLLNSRKPSSQFKLLMRLRVRIDRMETEKREKVLGRLCRQLLEYLTEILTYEFETRRQKWSPTNGSHFLPYRTPSYWSNLCTQLSACPHFNAFATLHNLEKFVLELVEKCKEEVVSYFRLRLCAFLCRIFPQISAELKKILLDPSQSKVFITPAPTGRFSYPTAWEIAFLWTCDLCFPFSDKHHALGSPLMIGLETWMAHLSSTDERNKDEEEEADGLIKPQQRGERRDEEPSALKVISCIQLIAVAWRVASSAVRYFPSFFPLAMVCLGDILRPGVKTTAQLETIPSVLACCRAYLLALRSHTDSVYIICQHCIIPSLQTLLREISRNSSEEVTPEIVSALEEFLQLSKEISTQPLLPLQLFAGRVQGIRQLTPKYVNPSDPLAAELLLGGKGGESLQQLRLKKLRRKVTVARRDAGRHLRKDAEFVARIRAFNASKANRRKEEKLRSVMKMLHQDQADYKNMKTCGGTLDTSLQPFSRNKKQKKERRMPEARGGRMGFGGKPK